jgi:hypothetical protein
MNEIRSFAEIPDILTMDIAPVEYLVPALGVARNTITLWTAPDGDGKTYVAQTMSAAIAIGGEFLGMVCQQSPVLYLDLENPAYTVQARMQAIAEASNFGSNWYQGSSLKQNQQLSPSVSIDTNGLRPTLAPIGARVPAIGSPRSTSGPTGPNVAESVSIGTDSGNDLDQLVRNTNFKVWGIWNEQQPPAFGSELLLTIAKEIKPVIVIDPFRYWHNAEENDSTAMKAVMQYCRALSRYGCAVILLHHPSKTEGSTGRGSSVIRGACDLALLHSLDKESGLITLKVDKNRHGQSRTITIRADFESGKFELAESPYIAQRKEELAKIEEVIKAQPGITQNGIAKQCGIRKGRLPRLLEEGRGTLWSVQSGANRSKLFYPLSGSSVVREPLGTSDTTGESGGVVVPVVRRLIGGTTVPPTDPGKSLPSCLNCGSFFLHSDGSCETCDYRPRILGRQAPTHG